MNILLGVIVVVGSFALALVLILLLVGHEDEKWWKGIQ